MSKYVSYFTYFIAFICFILSCLFLILFLIGYFFLNEKLSIKKIIASIIGLISLLIFMTDIEGGGHVH